MANYDVSLGEFLPRRLSKQKRSARIFLASPFSCCCLPFLPLFPNLSCDKTDSYTGMFFEAFFEIWISFLCTFMWEREIVVLSFVLLSPWGQAIKAGGGILSREENCHFPSSPFPRHDIIYRKRGWESGGGCCFEKKKPFPRLLLTRTRMGEEERAKNQFSSIYCLLLLLLLHLWVLSGPFVYL